MIQCVNNHKGSSALFTSRLLATGLTLPLLPLLLTNIAAFELSRMFLTFVRRGGSLSQGHIISFIKLEVASRKLTGWHDERVFWKLLWGLNEVGFMQLLKAVQEGAHLTFELKWILRRCVMIVELGCGFQLVVNDKRKAKAWRKGLSGSYNAKASQ